VQQPDPLRASAGGYGKPINQAEYRCEKAADDACGDVPIRNGGEGCRLTPQVQAVEYDGGDEEAEWKDNQHRMNWMPEKFGSAFHRPHSFPEESQELMQSRLTSLDRSMFIRRLLANPLPGASCKGTSQSSSVSPTAMCFKVDVIARLKGVAAIMSE
jgi:hypothetical protein